MSLSDYLKGPKFKAEAIRLQKDLNEQRLKFQSDLLEQQVKYNQLELKAKEIGTLDLIEVRTRIKSESDLLEDIKKQIEDAQIKLKSENERLL